MSILKNKMAERFAQIPNELTEDLELSAKAFRVACYLFSRPTDWEVNNKDIQKKLGIKRRESMSKYWQELINTGWLTRTRKVNNQGNQLPGYDYSLNIEPARPCTKKADTVKPCTEKACTQNADVRKNRTLTNNNKNTNTKTNKQDAVVVAGKKIPKAIADQLQELPPAHRQYIVNTLGKAGNPAGYARVMCEKSKAGELIVPEKPQLPSTDHPSHKPYLPSEPTESDVQREQQAWVRQMASMGVEVQQ